MMKCRAGEQTVGGPEEQEWEAHVIKTRQLGVQTTASGRVLAWR